MWPATTQAATTWANLTQSATTQAATTPVSSDVCIVITSTGLTINACYKPVYIRSKILDRIFDGSGYAYLQEDDAFFFRAKPPPLSAECLWNLKKLPNGNVQLWSLSINAAFRVRDYGIGDEDYIMSFEENEGDCSEFTLQYNNTGNGYTISIPVGYPRAGARIALGVDVVNGSDCVLTYDSGPETIWLFEPAATASTQAATTTPAVASTIPSAPLSAPPRDQCNIL